MTLHVTQLEPRPEHRSFRLSRPALATANDVREDLVLPAEQARAVLAAAAAKDVASGGAFSPGPAGVQVWSGAWNGPTGGAGTSEHLGSVDWSWDTPASGYVTVYRVMLTAAGSERGFSTDSLLRKVLGLAAQDGPRSSVPLPRDAFDTATVH